jgi:hypothetical protein
MPTALTRESAHEILKQFDCLLDNSLQPPTPLNDDLIRQALLFVVAESEYQMLGICAETLEQGIQALAAYGRALGYAPNLQLDPVEGAVYIKFNPNSVQCYASPYPGEHRGVLVSCQSTDEAGLNEMYGHLPLDLFDSPD